NGGQINTASTNCLVVDNPQQLTNQVQPCVVNTPYQSRFRINGSVQLPWGGVQLAAVYQDLPGPMIAANFTFTSALINAQPTGGLGRNCPSVTIRSPAASPFCTINCPACCVSVVVLVRASTVLSSLIT